MKKNEDRRVRAGHLWIFSNEIANLREDFTPGELVEVVSHGGNFIGRGYINPHSLIAVRLLTRARETIDAEFFANRISRALALRERLFPGEETFRVVFAESDGLPGLVIDKYARALVIQVSTMGMHTRLGEIAGAIPVTGLSPSAIVLRADTPLAELEGFEGENRVLSGEPEFPLAIEHDGLTFLIDILEGQKTGFYLDQRENRRALAGLVDGLSVLDCFCYTGAWSLYAARHGARKVLGIDSSARAIEIARRNAALNSLDTVCTFERADAFERLAQLVERGERFGCVILDPPAFVKSRRQSKEGEAAYERINRMAMSLLEPDGFLVSCSCSFHISREKFMQILAVSARKARRAAVVVEWRGEARDHPVLPAMPETDYLKCAVMRIH